MTLAGLRPGEKLFEEKLMAEEGLKKTKNKLIHIGCPIPFNTEQLRFVKSVVKLWRRNDEFMAYYIKEHYREVVYIKCETNSQLAKKDIDS